MILIIHCIPLLRSHNGMCTRPAIRDPRPNNDVSTIITADAAFAMSVRNDTEYMIHINV